MLLHPPCTFSCTPAATSLSRIFVLADLGIPATLRIWVALTHESEVRLMTEIPRIMASYTGICSSGSNLHTGMASATYTRVDTGIDSGVVRRRRRRKLSWSRSHDAMKRSLALTTLRWCWSSNSLRRRHHTRRCLINIDGTMMSRLCKKVRWEGVEWSGSRFVLVRWGGRSHESIVRRRRGEMRTRRAAKSVWVFLI